MTTAPKDTGFEAQPYYGICTFGRAPRGEYSDSFIHYLCSSAILW